MVGFAQTNMGSAEGRLHRGTPRLISLVVTVLVHILALVLVAYGQFSAAPKRPSSSTEQVVLVPPPPESPDEPEHELEAAPSPAIAKVKPAQSAGSRAELAAPIMPTDVPGLPAEASGPPPEGNTASDAVQDYRRELFERLAAQRHYPEAALLKHYQGDGAVLFRIDRGGNLLDAAMERSTGRALLDRAAIKQVRRAAPFPQIPPELPDELAVAMPLQFLIVQPGPQMAAR
ncbi:energy transducer TonB [Novosphingobium sp. ZW T3_23]|uniref:energy transducer TonB family protein n=1 Tax=Novosphingobium sp. ZW T3_23 TaxID=3378084 RepID=UPI0038530A52